MKTWVFVYTALIAAVTVAGPQPAERQGAAALLSPVVPGQPATELKLQTLTSREALGTRSDI